MLKTLNKKDIIRLLSCFIVFVFAFSIRVNFVRQKEGLHMDETLSVIISNYTDYAYIDKKTYDKDSVYTGKQLKEMSLWNKSSVSDAFSDIKKLYFDNRDRPHTNLFYSCFRLWFAGVVTTDTKEIIERGCKLNLLFFTFSFFFLYKLLRRLFDSDLLIAFSLLIAFINTGTVSNTLFMRPYQLQEMLMILFTYVFVTHYESIEKRENLLKLENFYKTVPVTALTLLSGYFAAMYILMLFGILAFLCIKNKQKDNLKFLYISLISSILFARFLFCGFFYGFSCGRAGAAFSKFNFNVLFENFIYSTSVFFEKLQTHLFYTPILWVMFFISATYPFIHEKFNNKKLQILVPLCCILWGFGNMFLAPYKELRYVMACFPLLVLIIPFIISHQKRNFQIFSVIVVSLVYIPTSLLDASQRVENLFVEQSKISEFFTCNVQNRVFFLSKTIWKYSNVLHLLSNDQKYEFPDSKESLIKKLKQHKRAIVIFSDDYNLNEIGECLPEGYKILSQNKFTSFSGFELEKL